MMITPTYQAIGMLCMRAVMLILWLGIAGIIFASGVHSETEPDLFIELSISEENPVAGRSFWLDVNIPDDKPVNNLYGISMEITISAGSGNASFVNTEPQPGSFWSSGVLLTFYEFPASNMVDYAVSPTDQQVESGSGQLVRFRVEALGEGEVRVDITRLEAINNEGEYLTASTQDLTITIAPAPETLQVPLPVSPQLNSINIPINASFSWTSVSDALAYVVQVFRAENPTEVFRQVNASDTTITIRLEEYTDYLWRVRAISDLIPDSDWSALIPFTTLIEPPTVVFPAPNSNGISTAPYLVWEREITGLSVQVQLSVTGGFNSIISSQLADGDRIRIHGLSPATTYFVRFRYFDPINSRVSDFSVSSFTTRLVPAVNSISSINYSIASESTEPASTDYRLIGFPADRQVSSSTIGIGIPQRDFRLFRENGNELEELSASDVWEFERGRGYWIIARSSFTISRTHPTPAPDSNDGFNIRLHPGWNIISSPFSQNIDWMQVQQLNAINWSLFSFDGTYTTTNTMNPGVGYYVFNTSASPFDLEIPFSQSIHVQPAKAPPLLPVSTYLTNITQEENGVVRKMHFTAAFEEETYTITRGFGAPEEYNRLHPPPAFSTIGITLAPQMTQNRSQHPSSRLYRTVYIGKDKPDESLPVHERVYIANKEAAPIHLRCTESYLDEYYPFPCTLIQETTGRAIDIPEDGLTMILADGYYVWVAGHETAINQVSELYLPESVQLIPAFPNPFNASTTLAFRLPETLPTRLVVYDVLGRPVQTLVNDMLPAGYHSYTFDGTQLSSGLYIYVLEAGRLQMSRTFLLIQ